MAKKEPLGFKTPSMRIQEEYKEILDQIKEKEANWEKAFKECKKMYGSASDRLEATLEESKSGSEQKSKESILADLIDITYQTLLTGQLLTKVMVAGVGQELTECDVRIAAIEKDLKDLRKGL